MQILAIQVTAVVCLERPIGFGTIPRSSGQAVSLTRRPPNHDATISIKPERVEARFQPLAILLAEFECAGMLSGLRRLIGISLEKLFARDPTTQEVEILSRNTLPFAERPKKSSKLKRLLREWIPLCREDNLERVRISWGSKGGEPFAQAAGTSEKINDGDFRRDAQRSAGLMVEALNLLPLGAVSRPTSTS
jgi:hypothetical protein